MSNDNYNPTDGSSTSANPVAGQQLRLPEQLVSQIKQRLPRTEFESVEAYVTFVMESVLREVDEQDEATHEASDHEGETSDAMQERLESLGYL